MEPTEGSQSSIQQTSLEAVQNKLEKFQTPEIVFDEASATITFRDIHLTKDNPTTSKVTVVFEKQPLRIEEGKKYTTGRTLVDKESEKMRGLAAQSEALKQVSERERPRAVLELLRQNVHYAYPDVMAVVERENPDLAKWVAENTGLNAPQREVTLSEIFDKGYGICHHLSVTYLWLAQKAGLQGTFMSTNDGGIRNIQRTDKKGKLFNMTEVGELVGAHSWIEIQMSDGTWIPVDPSTQLVGDTEEGMQMFKDANYKALSGSGLLIDASPKTVSWRAKPPIFSPGEATAGGNYWLLLGSSERAVRFGQDSIPPTNIPYQGDAELKITTDQDSNYYNFSIKNVSPSVSE